MALIEYQLRVRNAGDSADALTVTSVRGGTNPYISEGGTPSGDGTTVDALSGKITAGVITGRIIDPITSGTSRLFTSLLEDANERQQLGQRKAYWEYRVDGGAWTVLAAGRLSKFRLVSDIEWEIAVSDWMQAEQGSVVFGMKQDETFATYLARWPNRGCIIGGPLYGAAISIPVGPVPFRDLGGWGFDTSYDAGLNRTILQFAYGRGPHNGFQFTQNLSDLIDRVNDATGPYYRDGGAANADPDGESHLPGRYPDIAVIVGGVSGIQTAIGGQFLQNLKLYQGIVLEGNASTGGRTWVWALTKDVSDACPIFWVGHPMDLITKLYDEVGIPYSSSSVTTVKQTIGATVRFAMRVTKSENMGAFLEPIRGFFGIGSRMNSSGQVEFFASRAFPNTLPSITITSADVVERETHPFDLDTGSALHQVVVEHQRFVASRERFDGVDEVTDRFERTNDDPGSIGTGEQTYTLRGMVHVVGSPDGMSERVNALAAHLFDRWGRGPIAGETVLLRGGAGDTAKLGDEILVNLPQLPNHNKRLLDDGTVAARAMQILHLTRELRGARVELLDSGPNANPVATVPTLSIAVSSDNPRHVAEVTVTNAATLNALPAGLILQLATAPSGTPAATDYVDAFQYEPGLIPTTAVRLPATAAGYKVYARAESTQPTKRPSNWSTAVGTTLTVIDPPTSVTATPVGGDGSVMDLAWTVGTNAAKMLTNIYVRASGAAFSTAILKRTLPLGSNRVRVEGLTLNTAYTFSVEHLDESTDDRSTVAEATNTTTNATLTLSAPTYPVPFSAAAWVS